jgi:hypothetical protein
VGSIVTRAEAIADLLRRDEDLEADPPVLGIRSSTSIRDTVPPCLLVVPVPGLDYTASTLEGSIEVEWTIVALAQPPADLEAARELELLVDRVSEVLDVTRARPASYRIPTTETDVPAYLITVNETAAEE